MTKILQTAIVVVLVAGATGCVSTMAYLTDRGRDACDMITVSVETTGLNAGVEALGLGSGLGVAAGYGFGLRSGIVGSYGFTEANLVLGGSKNLEAFGAAVERSKGYENHTYLAIPFVNPQADGNPNSMYQIEMSACAGVGGRVGVNIGEIVDFILGLFMIDFPKDDLAATTWRRERNASQAAATNGVSAYDVVVLADYGMRPVALSPTQTQALESATRRWVLVKSSPFAPRTDTIEQALVYLWGRTNIKPSGGFRAFTQYRGFYCVSPGSLSDEDDDGSFKCGYALKKGTGEIYYWWDQSKDRTNETEVANKAPEATR
jgi:hypothetical protein